MPKCDFNKVAKQLYLNHTSAWVFSVNLLHIFRTPFLKNTFGWLLLDHFTIYDSQVFRQKCFDRGIEGITEPDWQDKR